MEDNIQFDTLTKHERNMISEKPVKGNRRICARVVSFVNISEFITIVKAYTLLRSISEFILFDPQGAVSNNNKSQVSEQKKAQFRFLE